MNESSTETLTESEPFIPYADIDAVPVSLKKRLKPYIERMGFLPNALKLYSHRPEIAETIWDLNNKVMRDPSSSLDQELKRKLGTLASKLNGCKYCTSHHCAILQNSGFSGAEGWDMDDNELGALLDNSWEPENSLERACINYVTEASLDPANVRDETLDELKKNLSPPQIIELATVVGFWKMYNTIHDSLKIPIESRLFDISKKTGI